VVVGATDPNPAHCGKGLRLLKRAAVRVRSGLLAKQSERLNEAFNHWIVARKPFVTVKAAMSLDGKIATSSGESKWITGEQSRAFGMKLRASADAILVGVNTVIADDPSLTVRHGTGRASAEVVPKRRLVLDSSARTPLHARVVTDEFRALTTIVVTSAAPKRRVCALSRKAKVLVAPGEGSQIYLKWLLNKLGSEEVISLLVEGGGEVNASFLLGGFAHRVAFFYAPKVLGGEHAVKAVAGEGASRLEEAIELTEVEYRWLGKDLFMTALVQNSA
jgi:diaminohydroxyphosphoribosylaminopyrimidine deaminase/5-amino-6-(5-phosphoribosylamino)uracil reductase